MVWPVSDVSTTAMDSANDSPATARAAILDLAQKFNQLRVHVSTKWQSLLSGGFYTPGVQPAFAAALALDADASNVVEVGTLTGNVTSMTIANAAVGRVLRIRFVQDATGTRTVALPAGAVATGSVNTVASKVSWLTFVYANNGGAPRWEGFWTQLP